MTPSRSKALILVLVIIGAIVCALDPGRNMKAQQRGEVYSSQTKPQTTLKGGVQQDVGCGNPGGGTTTQQPGVGDSPYCHCSDPVCGGTNRRCYDAAYGTRSLVVSENVMQQLYNATRGAVWIRCGTCAGNAICWPRPFYVNWVNQCLNAAAAGKTCPNPPQDNFNYPHFPPGNMNGSVLGTANPCEPKGPGGYNYCDNPAGTQPAGCVCPSRTGNSNPPTSNSRPLPPTFDPLQYGKGVFEGLLDCAGAFRDLGAAAGYMVQGNFVAAANALGLQPGESVTLRAIFQEATTQNLGISPEEAGRIAGRRLCAYAIVPAALKIPKTLKGLNAPGASSLNPIKGGGISKNARSLAGKWVDTPSGPIRLGINLGNGKFASVYKLPQGRAIKISTLDPDAGASFNGQKAGADLLRKAGIPTPSIYGVSVGGPGEPSFLYTDDVTATGPGSAWKNGQILGGDVNLDVPKLTAIRDLYTQIRNAGLTWADGHAGNVFWFGNGTAGVLDADMVFESNQLLQQPKFTMGNIQDAFQRAGMWNPVLGLPGWNALLNEMIGNPASQMNNLWNAQFEFYFPGAAGPLTYLNDILDQSFLPG